MGEKEYRLENKEAVQKSEDELYMIMYDCFLQAGGKVPTREQDKGLREAAQCIKGHGVVEVTWKQVKRSIMENTWDPAEGPRALYSSG